MNSPDLSGTFHAPVHVGTSITDIRTVVLGVFHENAPKLLDEAGRIAQTRVTDFILQLTHFAKSLPNIDGALNEPDIQYQINAAVQASVRTDDSGLRRQLASLLTNRIAVGSDNMRRQFYNEAIVVAPKLSPNQLKLLGLVLLGRYAGSPSMLSMLSLANEYLQYVEPLLDAVAGATDIQHLMYLGCVSQIGRNLDMHANLADRFPLLFQRGLSDEEFRAVNLPDRILQKLFIQTQEGARWLLRIPPSMIQAEMDDEMGTEDTELIKMLFGLFQLPSLKEMNDLVESSPILQRMVKKFSGAQISGIELMPVGLVIAATYVEQLVGYKIGIDALFNNKPSATVSFRPVYGLPKST